MKKNEEVETYTINVYSSVNVYNPDGTISIHRDEIIYTCKHKHKNEKSAEKCANETHNQYMLDGYVKINTNPIANRDDMICGQGANK